jgi:hypothetical protein
VPGRTKEKGEGPSLVVPVVGSHFAGVAPVAREGAGRRGGEGRALDNFGQRPRLELLIYFWIVFLSFFFFFKEAELCPEHRSSSPRVRLNGKGIAYRESSSII